MGAEMVAGIYDDMERLWSHIADLEDKITEEFNKLKVDIDRSERELLSMKQILRVSSELQKFQKNIASINDLYAMLQNLSDRLNDLQIRLNKVETVMGKISDIENEVNDTGVKLSSMTSTISAISQNMGVLTGKIDMLVELTEKLEKQNKELQSKVESQDTEIKKLRQLYNDEVILRKKIKEKIDHVKELVAKKMGVASKQNPQNSSTDGGE